jgi:DUF917 family protein
MTAAEQLTADDLPAFSAGAALLGCGGGGRVDNMLSALLAVGRGFAVDLLRPDTVGDGFVAAVGLIGSTTVMEEKMPSGRELPATVAAIEQWTGLRIGAVMPAQIGGLTSLAAASLADQLGLPLVDADLEGRATPRLDQLTIFGPAADPVTAVAVTSSGLTVVVSDATPSDLETVWRDAIAHSGGWGAFAIGPLSTTQVRENSIHGSVSRAVTVGHALSAAGSDVGALAASLGGTVLGRGRVIDIERYEDRVNFVANSVVALDVGTGAVMRLEASSEYVLVLVDGEPKVSAPTVIAVLDSRTLEPIATVDVGIGANIVVLALPGASWWRAEPERLRRTGPRAYGIDSDVLPEIGAASGLHEPPGMHS